MTRNYDKLNKAEAELKIENANFDRIVKDIHTISNKILNELTIRFTVQIQLEYYEQMEKVFSRVKDIEQKMNDICYQQEQVEANKSHTSQRIIQDSGIVPAHYASQSLPQSHQNLQNYQND